MLRKPKSLIVVILWPLLWVVMGHPVFTSAGGIPAVGSQLPEFKLETPASVKDQEYLGVKNSAQFSIHNVKAQVSIIEIVGVFCPHCHTQAPLFNTLFHRLKKNPKMDSKIRMMAIAVGTTPMEVAYMKEQLNIPFPLIREPDFATYKVLGEPRTPFTMVVNKDKKIVFAHSGVISDMDNFFAMLQKLLS